jgi:hypothetical protein
VTGDVRRFASIGELHADPQELWRDRVATLAGHGPTPTEAVGEKVIRFATKLIRGDGDRCDVELKPLRVRIQVADRHYGYLRAGEHELVYHRSWR